MNRTAGVILLFFNNKNNRNNSIYARWVGVSPGQGIHLSMSTLLVLANQTSNDLSESLLILASSSVGYQTWLVLDCSLWYPMPINIPAAITVIGFQHIPSAYRGALCLILSVEVFSAISRALPTDGSCCRKYSGPRTHEAKIMSWKWPV